MSEGREWIRNRTVDDFVAEQRKLAGDTRLGPGVRVDALRRLCVLAGYSSSTILGDDNADKYTRRLLSEPTNAVVSDIAQPTPAPRSRIEDALRKYEERK